MDLAELKAFLAVVETGSIAAAAQGLGTSRSSLARRLKALEDRVKTPLVRSGSSGTQLTEAGRVLAARAPALIREATDVLDAVMAQAPEPSRPLRLLVTAGPPPSLLDMFLCVIAAHNPDLAVHVAFASTSLIPKVADAFDAVVHLDKALLPDHRWQTLVSTAVREWLVATPAYLAEHGEPSTVAELEGHRLLAWDAPGRPGDRWPLLHGGQFAASPTAVVHDIHILRHLAAHHRGIALLPDLELAEPDFPPGTFQVVLRNEVGAVLDLQVSVPVAGRRSPVLDGVAALFTAAAANV